MSFARELWQRVETIHAVTYFATESRDAARAAGLPGFWMGYFGCRAAPLGAATAGSVEATFGNFAPAMVRRAVPVAWSYASPDDLVRLRATAAATALRRLAPGVERAAAANGRLAAIVAAAAPIGRPLFAANRALPPFDDPIEQLWQHCTTLREHRGDGHVLALASAGIDGCEAHVLVVAAAGTPADLLRDNRGWTIDEWEQAAIRLRSRGLLDDEHLLTERGREARSEIEERTDRLGGAPIDAVLGEREQADLLAVLTPPALEIVASGVLPFPNPMGLPPLAES